MVVARNRLFSVTLQLITIKMAYCYMPLEFYLLLTKAVMENIGVVMATPNKKSFSLSDNDKLCSLQ